ncbi:MAG: bifunctional 3-deoxy-7-phosphoheptulonate synthase/chorismate mutase type II [Muribaculaceae bacterium]|nr:bifunctional 3-deoxy-7-phosphoheptulonate synthase/chorismate mutase type II [Muribaculaceae bacterium]
MTEYFKDLAPITFDGIDNNRPLVIAGPCSAESREQIFETARGVKAAGVGVFRAGIWKPRTKPGGFEGVGIRGLLWLAEVKRDLGLLTATEVATRDHVAAALDAGVDILWIGARTSANPFAMQDIANALQGHPEVTVLVKNPVNPDLELWIGALQRIYNAGVRRLGAIHRGFSTYGKHLYRNEPQWYIPIELHRRVPQLPILSDPSHMGGKRELIAPIAQQALDMDFAGLMIETHCNPDCALSDRDQQVTPEALNLILNTLVMRDKKQSTENLNLLRQQIDRCDNELLEVLSRRMRVSREIGQYKLEHNMSVVQAGRYSDIMADRLRLASEMGIGADCMQVIMQAIHEESVRQQIEIVNKA